NDLAAIAADKFANLVTDRRRMRLDWFVRQEPHDVGGETVGRSITPAPFLLQRLEHDPIEIAAQERPEPARLAAAIAGDDREAFAERADALARPRRFLFADEPLHFRVRRLAQRHRFERRRAGEKLVQKNAERVD